MDLLDALDDCGGFTHAFLTTYKFQPVFFEERVLSRKALSTCPNIVIFVDRASYEEVCSQATGGTLINRRYMVVPTGAGSHGVFHPKLWLFSGVKHGCLFLGSANLTRPGVTSNMEMVSLLDNEGMPEQVPPLLSSAFHFLQAVSERLCPQMPSLGRILAAARLSPTLSADDGGQNEIRLVHNLDSALIDALPHLDSVQVGVTVFGPYYDSGIGALLNSLQDRYKLSQVEIVLQQDTNTLDVAALDKWCVKNPKTRVLLSVVEIPHRLLHAKGVIVADEQGNPRAALVGSANFTESALRFSTAKGGNVEACLLLAGEAASAVAEALSQPPFSARLPLSFADVRARQELPTFVRPTDTDELRLEGAEIVADFSAVEAFCSGRQPSGIVPTAAMLCVQKCDSAIMDFSCPLKTWDQEGRLRFELAPGFASLLTRAAKAWLSIKLEDGRVLESNAVWLVHLDEVAESEKTQRAKILRQLRESGKGLTAYLQALIDQGAFDRSVDLLEKLSIKYSAAMTGSSGVFLRPHRPKSPIREDELPESIWRLTMDQRRRLGLAVKEFVERHHEKVLEKHVKRPNPNGLENFLDVLETCTDLLVKSAREELLEHETVVAMLRGGLGLCAGNLLHEGYVKALRDHLWGQVAQLGKAYADTGAAERIVAILIAVVCAVYRGKRNVSRSMDLKELVRLSDLPRLTDFFSVVHEPSPNLPERVRGRIAEYADPGFFTIELT